MRKQKQADWAKNQIEIFEMKGKIIKILVSMLKSNWAQLRKELMNRKIDFKQWPIIYHGE